MVAPGYSRYRDAGGAGVVWCDEVAIDANVLIIVVVLLLVLMPDSFITGETWACYLPDRPPVVLCGSTITQCRRGRKARRGGIGGNFGELGKGTFGCDLRILCHCSSQARLAAENVGYDAVVATC